jgi:PGF-pre-PGF domain-containing protein
MKLLTCTLLFLICFSVIVHAEFNLTNPTITKQTVYLDEKFRVGVTYTSDGEAPGFTYWAIDGKINRTMTNSDTNYTYGVVYEPNENNIAENPSYPTSVNWYGLATGSHTVKFYAGNSTYNVTENVTFTVSSDKRPMRGGAMWILTEPSAYGLCYDIAANLSALDGIADVCTINQWNLRAGDYESGGQVAQYRGMVDFNISGLSSSDIEKVYLFLYKKSSTSLHFTATANDIEGNGTIETPDFSSTGSHIGNFSNSTNDEARWVYTDVTTKVKNDIDNSSRNWTGFRISGGMEGTNEWFNNDSSSDFVDYKVPKLLVIPKVPIIPYSVNIGIDDFFVNTNDDMDWHIPAVVNISNATGVRITILVDAKNIDENNRTGVGSFGIGPQQAFSMVENNSDKISLQSNPHWAPFYNSTDGTHYTETDQRDKLNKTQQVFQDRNLSYEWLIFTPGANKMDNTTLAIANDYGVKYLANLFSPDPTPFMDNESYTNNILYVERESKSTTNPQSFLTLLNRDPTMQAHKQDFNWSTTSEQNWTDFINELYDIPDTIPSVNDKEMATQWLMYNYANLTWDVSNNRVYINTTPVPQGAYDDDLVNSFVLKLPYTNVTNASIDGNPVAYSENHNYTWFRIPYINRSNHIFEFTLGTDGTYYNGVIFNGTYLVKNITINSTNAIINVETYGNQSMGVKTDFVTVSSVTAEDDNITIDNYSFNSSTGIIDINFSEIYLKGDVDNIIITGSTTLPSTPSPPSQVIGQPTAQMQITIKDTGTRISIPLIKETKCVSAEIIEEMCISVKKEVYTATLEIEKLSETDQKPPGVVYQNFNIDKYNIKDFNIEKVKFRFAVNKSWIDENNINESSITLNRYTLDSSITGAFLGFINSFTSPITGFSIVYEPWTKLDTRKISETETEIFYEAESPGFSTFSITGQINLEPEEIPEEFKTPEERFDFAPVISVVLIIIGLIIFLGRYRK